MKKTVILCVLAIGLGLTALSLITAADAFAQESGSGSGSDPAPLPSDSLDNPLSAPGPAFDDLKAAKKIGWAALAFAIVTMGAMAAGTVGRNIPWLSWLNRGRAAVIVGGVFATGAAGYNAAVEGGSIMAMIMAVMLGAAAYYNSHREPKAPE